MNAFHSGVWRIVATALLVMCVLGVASVHAGQQAQGLVYPVDIAAAPDGGFVVADFKAHGLLRLFPNGTVQPLLLGRGLPRSPLYGARAVIPAPDGNGYLVADPGTFGLYRVDARGELSTITTELDIPQGLARFDDDSVLVSDLRSGLGAVLRVTLDGRVSVFADIPSPKGIAADGQDGFVVVSHGERALFRLDRQGGFRTLAAGPPFDFPHDVVRDSDGTYVVTDGYASALFRVTPDGQVQTLAQGPPLVNPQGIVLDGDHYLVTDPQAGGVFSVDRSGAVRWVAHSGTH